MPGKRVRPIIVTGKRKTASAKALIKSGLGRVRINKVPIELWQPEVARLKIMEPLILTDDIVKSLDIDATVDGGGFMSQAEAVRTAIARGIYRWSKREKTKKLLMVYDRLMLVGDPRQAEPKKFGGPSARTRKQKSYR